MTPDLGRQIGRTLEALRTGAHGDEWRLAVAGVLAGIVAEMDARGRAWGVARRWWLWAIAFACALPGAVLGWSEVFKLFL